MPKPDESFNREEFEVLMERLLECGWISGFGFRHGGGYGLQWTEKGRERAEWLRLIASELDLGPKGLTALMVICHQHAPGGSET